MVKQFFKRLFRRMLSRKTELKFCYSHRSAANRMFNALTAFFTDHRDEYDVINSKIYDCSPMSSTEFMWCVHFKVLELCPSGNSRSMKELCETLRKLETR